MRDTFFTLIILATILIGCSPENKEEALKLGCSPQGFGATLEASGNYYSYRNNKEFVNLDAATGMYQRLIQGEARTNSSTVYSKEVGCYYVRDGSGIDAAYGKQILFEAALDQGTEHFNPTEIYKIEQTGSSYLLTRNDDIGDWGYAFCPDLRTPWEFCTELRNGNIMYYPTLTALIQTSLLNEAILIRSKFSYKSLGIAAFDAEWETLTRCVRPLLFAT